MFHQTLSLDKSLRTEATRVHSNVEMIFEMQREGVPAVEGLLAERALGRMDLEVLVEELESSELFIAFCAHVSSFDLQAERRDLLL